VAAEADREGALRPSAPRLLAVGHVTRDVGPEGERLGGSVVYAALTARRLGWSSAIATSADGDLAGEPQLAGVRRFVGRSPDVTRFRNRYDALGRREQELLSRAAPVEPALVEESWRAPDVLLLAPVAGELPAGTAHGFRAGLVGATGQGWLRAVGRDGRSVVARDWPDPDGDLAGVEVLFLSLEDVAGDVSKARARLEQVPLVALTLGERGVELHAREVTRRLRGAARVEVDPTGAGDVFAAAFLVRYHETRDPVEAASFACCAASFAVEAVGASGLPDRAQLERRRREEGGRRPC
jgi:sugar/nucleoside kinase (ribokinase family)